eukprot:TRINITY_DN15197_c2_g1_i1.p1 TRINITY_DN15197_c2_g1~~TRINITY_DN15197_c2_g1_i1.p1  ORF type:complete len:335 (+),score=59.42 TRINITY_DN15197_c2_g1_i1:603-1607(+)
MTCIRQQLVGLPGPVSVVLHNLWADVREQELDAHFGSIPGRTLVDRSLRLKSTATATLFYATAHEAQLAVDLFGFKVFQGRTLVVALDETRRQLAERELGHARGSRQVYLGGLPHYTTEAQILRHFEGLTSPNKRNALPNLRDSIIEVRFRYLQCGRLLDVGIGEVYFDNTLAAQMALRFYDRAAFMYGVPRQTLSDAGLVWILDQQVLCQRSVHHALSFNLQPLPAGQWSIPPTRGVHSMLLAECVPLEQRGPEPVPTTGMSAAMPPPPRAPSPRLRPPPPSAESPPGAAATARTDVAEHPQRVPMAAMTFNRSADTPQGAAAVHPQGVAAAG